VNSLEANNIGSVPAPSGSAVFNLNNITPLLGKLLNALLGIPITTLSVLTVMLVLSNIGIPFLLAKLNG
jgi:hypothetical protein